MKRLWLALTVALVAGVYAPQLLAPFELQDDHRIIAPVIKDVPRGALGAVRSWVAELRSDVASVGRFRPVNQIFDVLGPRILGPSAAQWHLCLLGLAVAVTVLLFQAAFRLYACAGAAAVFALIVMLAPDPGPTSAWYRLGPKEAWGMLFLAGALVAMLRRRDVLAFVLAALCAYSKESFLLLVPALFGVRWWLEIRDSEKRPLAALWELRGLAVAYAVLLAGGMAGVLVAMRNAGAQSYGGRSMAVSGGTVLQVLARDVARAPLLAAGFVPALLALWVARKRLGRNVGVHVLAAAVFAAWIGPQYLLYATRGGLWDHYWLPCVVAFAAVNAAGLAVLAGESRVLYRVALAVVAIWTVNAVRTDVLAVVNFIAKARVQQAAVGIASSHVTPDSDLVIVADELTQSELAFSFADFVEERGGRFRRWVTHDPRVPFTAADPGQVIVYLDEASAGRPPTPGFVAHPVTGERVYFSVRQAKWVRIPFGFMVEVRQR